METIPFVGLIIFGFASVANAQHAVDPYSTGITLLGHKGCPVFVGAVSPGSPAERAGARPGDQLLAVAGIRLGDLEEAVRLFRANGQNPVVLTLLRGGKEVEVVSGVEKRSSIFARNGKKIISGVIVPDDTTEPEVDRMLNFNGQRYTARVFPTHYPVQATLFYAGFEIFVLHDPVQVTVGGIEDGPASRAGVHWGDVLLSVNGTSVSGKTPSELESMFSATHPITMRLDIDRLGSRKTFEIQLEKAEDVARQNGKRFVEGKLVPIWSTETELHCFLN